MDSRNVQQKLQVLSRLYDAALDRQDQNEADVIHELISRLLASGDAYLSDDWISQHLARFRLH